MIKPTNYELDAILDKEFKVLDHGFVRLVDYMGDEDSIANSARISYQKGTKAISENVALIDYLWRNQHTSVFESCEIQFHLKMPIFIAAQFLRHRTANLNQISARYSVISDEFYLPSLDQLCEQSKGNKQGRDKPLNQNVAIKIQSDMQETYEFAYKQYQKLLETGLARELARSVLPQAIYTELYWKMDAKNLMHFLKLRCDPHAQQEIREYAFVILDIFKLWLPNLYKTFNNHTVNSKNISANNLELLKQCIDPTKVQDMIAECDQSKGEKKEFVKVLQQLL